LSVDRVPGSALVTLVAALVMLAGCGGGTPAVSPTASAGSGGVAASGPAVTPGTAGEVKAAAELYVGFACVRCHAPDGVGGIPNRLNQTGDDDIPPLNNAYRDPTEQFSAAGDVTDVMRQGSILSHDPGVINMPSWNGVINDAQMNAIAAYVLAGFPQTDVQVDFDPQTAPDIYAEYACIRCHGQVGPSSSPSPAPNPLSPDGTVPVLRNPADTVSPQEFLKAIEDGSIPDPGVKGELFMPAWGQIMSTREVDTVLPYIEDGNQAVKQPAPPPAPTLPLAGPATPSPVASP
jgi:mono/diheme cytochrome c family protein